MGAVLAIVLFALLGIVCVGGVWEGPKDAEADASEDVAPAEETLIRGDGDSHVATYETSEELPDVAAELVSSYEEADDCLVRSAGYLDMFGSVWSCVMEGPGWVDLCLVSQGEDGCVVRVTRMEAKEWERSYAQEK